MSLKAGLARFFPILGGDVPPAAAVRRALRRRSFKAARTSNLEWDWTSFLLSSNREVAAALIKLRARSRDLSHNDPHMSSFIHLLRTNVVGRTGIGLQSRILDASGKPRPFYNQSVEVGWAGWGRKGSCTMDGRLSWTEVQALAIVTEAIDGEYIVRHRPGADNASRYAIQFIDPDLLDVTFFQEASTRFRRNKVEMGVEVDADNRPTAYHFLAGHPSEIGGDKRRERVSADQIEHGFVSLRAGQMRGIPWAAPVMLALNMFDGYTEAELVASRSAAAKAVQYTQDGESVVELEGELVDEVVPGTTSLLPPGVTPHQLDPQHPNSAYEAFQKAILRSIGSGLGVSYSALTGDLRDVNFSSIRTGLLQERDAWQCLQQHLIDHLCEPVFRRWLHFASMADVVKLPDTNVARWSQPHWQPRGWAWVDPVKDIQAAERGIRLGTTTRTSVCAAQGTDYEDNLRQLKRESELADAAGVDVAGMNATTGDGDGETNEANSVGVDDTRSGVPGRDGSGDEGEWR